MMGVSGNWLKTPGNLAVNYQVGHPDGSTPPCVLIDCQF